MINTGAWERMTMAWACDKSPTSPRTTSEVDGSRGKLLGGFKRRSGIDNLQPNRRAIRDELACHLRHCLGRFTIDRADSQSKYRRLGIPAVSEQTRAGPENDHTNQ